MTVPIQPSTASAPNDPLAFLGDIEHRAVVFAELLCGDRVRGGEALETAARGFRKGASRYPANDWPGQFWTLLLATPQLRHPSPAPHWPTSLAALARMGIGTRAAALLRLVAELDDAGAAGVLGIAPQTWRRALQQALPRQADGRVDADAWRALAQAAQRLLRAAPTATTAIQPHMAMLHPRLSFALRVALALCMIALIASFLLPGLHIDDGNPRVETTSLPPAEPPASTFDAETAVLTHPDFEQLADSRDEALVRDLDFYAWYAAQAASQPGADGGPLLFPDAATPAVPATQGGIGAR